MAKLLDKQRYKCALGAMQTVQAISRALPILHSGPGCAQKLSESTGSSGYFSPNIFPCTSINEKDVVYASIQLSKEALDSRFAQIIQRCEHWGSIKAFTTVFTDYQTISMHFILEMATERIGGLQNDPFLHPIIIHSKGREKREIND